jgi:hypothetical protein
MCIALSSLARYLELLHADTRQGDCLIILGRSFLININIFTFSVVLLLPSVRICIARAANLFDTSFERRRLLFAAEPRLFCSTRNRDPRVKHKAPPSQLRLALRRY